MAAAPSADEVRTWARNKGFDVGDRGRFSTEVTRAWDKAHPTRKYQGGTAASANSTPAPAKKAAAPAQRTTSNSRRAQPVTAEDSTPRTPMIATNMGEVAGFEEIVRSLAGIKGTKGGNPVIVSAHALVNA